MRTVESEPWMINDVATTTAKHLSCLRSDATWRNQFQYTECIYYETSFTWCRYLHRDGLVQRSPRTTVQYCAKRLLNLILGNVCSAPQFHDLDEFTRVWILINHSRFWNGETFELNAARRWQKFKRWDHWRPCLTWWARMCWLWATSGTFKRGFIVLVFHWSIILCYGEDH